MQTNQNLNQQWQQCFQDLPLIAILRGIQPGECLEIAKAIFDAGFRILEVPLNSPQPLESIALLAEKFPTQFIGAGTVTTVGAVDSCAQSGCKLVVTPNFNPKIAERVKQHDMIYYPGIATPSEAFMALEAGADGLKLFPAELISPAVAKALRAVLPLTTQLIPVGGITPDNMADYIAAGTNGFGIGSALYKPGKSVQDIRDSAQAFVTAFRSIQ
ncbi:MAG: 2-dehydro-3-deoxyphosphogalactonate aldolase [Parasphingorhabdus sp.]|jgi:2-dehydro-3-deoxyphosphogalactonate aldolase